MGQHIANMSDEEKPAIIMDNGTGMMKCGLSGTDAPTVTFASCVGYPKNKAMMTGGNKEYYVGEEAQQKRGILVLKFPLEHGVITNWDDMEKIWAHTFDNELRVVVGGDTDEDEDVAGVLLTESQMNLHTSAERMSAMKIKEELCYVSLNFVEEVDNFAGKEKQFELPDMSIVTVHNQIRCP